MTQYIMTVLAAMAAGTGMQAQARTIDVESGTTQIVGQNEYGINLITNDNTYDVQDGGILTDKQSGLTTQNAVLRNGATYDEAMASPKESRCNLTLAAGAAATFNVSTAGKRDETTQATTAAFSSTITGADNDTSTLAISSTSDVTLYEFDRLISHVNISLTSSAPNLLVTSDSASTDTDIIGTLDLGNSNKTVFTRMNLSVQTLKGKGALTMTGDADKVLTLGGTTLDRVDTSAVAYIGNTGIGVASLSNAEVTYQNFRLSNLSGDVKAALLSCGVTVDDGATEVHFYNTLTQDTLDAKDKALIFEGVTTLDSLSNVQSLTVGGAANVTLAQSLLNASKVTLQGGALTLNNNSGTLTTSELELTSVSTLNADLVLADGAMVRVAQGAHLDMGCSLTLQGGVSITLSDGDRADGARPLLVAQGVDDVLANGSSVTLNGSGWQKSESEDKWSIGVSEYYDEATGTYTYTTQTEPTGGGMMLVYDRTDAGNAKLILTPEPATATLSLLALAGLAARHRRA